MYGVSKLNNASNNLLSTVDKDKGDSVLVRNGLEFYLWVLGTGSCPRFLYKRKNPEKSHQEVSLLRRDCYHRVSSFDPSSRRTPAKSEHTCIPVAFMTLSRIVQGRQ
ncbi:hypothetical protein CDAR_506541 [Caerostris darwini]|uniref:Ycf15 n=1 Tax=Caerostris darwini TaxID=1538125 RepID=A0AAV4QEJ4_9ARAC|nr:hypothetical protein CDAR_506541 [Caerostris darwini]